jgi:hypothetical protein
LDNYCYNRPFDDQTQLIVNLETEAVLYIHEEIRKGKIELVWSYILDMENDDNPYEQKRNSVRN